MNLWVKRSPLVDLEFGDNPHLMSGGGGKGGGTTTTTSSSSPWKAQQPYLKEQFSEAQKLYQGAPPQYYPQSTVTPFSPETLQALQLQSQRALAGSPINAAAGQSLTDTLSGNYLSAGNPYFSQMADRIAGEVLPRVDSSFEAAGRSGSPAAERARTMALADSLGSLAYQNYGDERTNMIKAAIIGPQVAGQDYQDISALGQVGSIKENQAQQQLNDLIARWNFQQQLPAEMLNQYINQVRGNFGGVTQTSQPYFTNPVGNAVGGAMAGSAFGPIGTAAGGGLGLLLGK